MTSSMERFWSKVDRRSASECWEWLAGRHPFGHGRFRLPTGHIGAHRMAWMLTHGPIPEGLWVLHHCDNPPCVNPAHLYLGTSKNNAADREARGRSLHPLKATCKHGHPLAGDNLYTTYPPSLNGRALRSCRECGNRRHREYTSRKKTRR